MTFDEFVAQKEQNQNIVNSAILSIKKSSLIKTSFFNYKKHFQDLKEFTFCK